MTMAFNCKQKQSVFLFTNNMMYLLVALCGLCFIEGYAHDASVCNHQHPKAHEVSDILTLKVKGAL